MFPRFRLPIFAIAALVLIGLAWPAAEPAARPYDAHGDGRDQRLMLGGHDPVAYQLQGRAVPGRTDLRVVHEGVTYRFATEDSRAQFERDPSHWVPAFGGYCAQGMVEAVPLPARADVFEVIDGRLYLFGSERAKAWFLMERERNLALARRWWREEVSGSIGLLQRAWRMLVPVPTRRAPEEVERDYRDRLHTGRL